jgi:ribosome-associated protein
VEAVFDVEASRTLDERQRDLLLGRAGALITAVAQDARGQARNRELALKRLAEKIAAGLAEPVRRRPTRPTRASRMKRL